ncbi:MAG TPA: agmatinase [Anaerolineales bacterium]|nr:agmatinase [Anaerolineales bacterium]
MPIRSATIDTIPSKAVAILGIPWDENSSFLRGAASAPDQIRHVLNDGASNLYSESGMNLEAQTDLVDIGNLAFQTNSPIAEIENSLQSGLEGGARFLCLGGDHAITYPVFLAYAQHYDKINILHIDAHPDLYDEFDGNRLSHACPFARIMETGKVGRLVQIGIRSLNTHLRQQIERFHAESYPVEGWTTELVTSLQGPLYLSLDIDGLDPAFAPGISHHEPGGLTTREVLSIIQAIQAPLVGADIVELNPTRDINQMTARLAAKFLREIAAKMLA